MAGYEGFESTPIIPPFTSWSNWRKTTSLWPRKSITGFDLSNIDGFYINTGINRISHFFDEVTLDNHKNPNGDLDFNNTKNLQNRDQRMAIARRRIADGYYNSPEHIGKLADIFIDKFGLFRSDIKFG